MNEPFRVFQVFTKEYRLNMFDIFKIKASKYRAVFVQHI